MLGLKFVYYFSKSRFFVMVGRFYEYMPQNRPVVKCPYPVGAGQDAALYPELDRYFPVQDGPSRHTQTDNGAVSCED